MENNVPGISIISKFINSTFESSDIEKLWDACPNRMLWEAIRTENATIVSHEDILTIVKQTSKVYVVPEPLPSFYQNHAVVYTLVSSSDFIDGFFQYITMEPLYLIDYAFSWMIVLTTENTPSGGQLCALVNRFHPL